MTKDLLRLYILKVSEKPQVRNIHFEMFYDRCIKVRFQIDGLLDFIYFNYNKQLKIGRFKKWRDHVLWVVFHW